MRPAPTALVTALQAGTQFQYADCNTFTLRDGTVARYASSQYNVLVPRSGAPGLLFIAGDVLVSGLKFKSTIGVNVDEQTVTVAYQPTSMIDGQTWPVALREGLFDGATLQRDRAFLPAFGQVPIANALVPLFHGRISTISTVGRVEAQITVKADTNLLNLDMPRNLWQAGCLHTLFDAGCTLDKNSFGVQGTVGAGSTVSAINWSGATAGLFDQGTVKLETGANTAITRTVKASTGSQLLLAYPLDFAVATGDEFVVYWGCDKTTATCQGRFNNLVNFRGFPFVPTPETAS